MQVINNNDNELLKALRQLPEFAAAGSAWTPDEDAFVISAANKGRALEAIAAYCKRTTGCIKRRLLELAVRMIDEGGRSASEVCVTLRLDPDDVWRIMQGAAKRKEEEEKVKDDTGEETLLEVVRDIRDALRRMERAYALKNKSAQESIRA